jgi:hypothetical protein
MFGLSILLIVVGAVLELRGYFRGVHEDTQRIKRTKGTLLIFTGLLIQAAAIAAMFVTE